jgi:hypothetical protein
MGSDSEFRLLSSWARTNNPAIQNRYVCGALVCIREGG